MFQIRYLFFFCTFTWQVVLEPTSPSFEYVRRVMIELAPKAMAEINPKIDPSMAKLWHIYKENGIRSSHRISDFGTIKLLDISKEAGVRRGHPVWGKRKYRITEA